MPGVGISADVACKEPAAKTAGSLSGIWHLGDTAFWESLRNPEIRLAPIAEFSSPQPGRCKLLAEDKAVLCRTALIIVFTFSSAHAQPTGTSSSFEVVSVRPAAPPNGRSFHVGARGGPGTSDPGRMTFSYMTLARLVSQAHCVEAFELSCPDWLYDARFDIVAKVPEGATKEEIPVMLQNLLADRFKLKVHREMRDMPVFELSVAKGGPKLKAANNNLARQEGVTGEPSLDRGGFPEIPPGRASKMVIDGRARWQDPDAEIERLARMLAVELGRPVTDSTGLKGRYSISLYWVQDEMRATQPTANPDTDAATPTASTPDGLFGPSIFGALRDQLGLRIEPKRGAASILVVDSAARLPTEN